MTASLAYILGSSNSLVWSWFFWIHVHPIASIIWFIICLFALAISLEVRQLEQTKTSSLIPTQNRQVLQYGSANLRPIESRGIRATDTIDVVIIPPPQLPSPKNTAVNNRKSQIETVTLAQLSNSID